MLDYNRKTYVKVGDRVRMEIAYSECAMSMHVAGKVMEVEVIQGRWGPIAQLYKDGKEFSAPITMGEAGFYQEQQGVYYYYPSVETCKWFLKCTNIAITTQDHPMFGKVPICAECLEKENNLCQPK